MNHTEANLLSRAISFAARSHSGQVRKDGETPYFAHPVRVMTILLTQFGVRDPEVLAAAVLHDTIEDTTADRDDLIEHFGPRVAELVAVLSKDKRLPEDERERRYFDDLAAAPLDAKLCKLGDALDNLVDCESLPPGGRRKAADKAKQLLELFAPGFPGEWEHVLDIVRDQCRRTERL